MAIYLGVDTSNYTASLALLDGESARDKQCKRPIQVPFGERGLRQSEVLFHHVRELPALFADLFVAGGEPLAAVGVSDKPRSGELSYMPCFLAGVSAAASAAAVHGVQLYRFSHQEGHIAAALYSVGCLGWLLGGGDFLAFHFSGGTTECLLCRAKRAEGGELIGIDAEVFASTSDVNAGQVIDRIGVEMGLPFPAGRELERLAANSRRVFNIKPSFVDGMPSFSGLENRAKKMLQSGDTQGDVANYLFSYTHEVIYEITRMAFLKYGKLPCIYSGGVLSNLGIQHRLAAVVRSFVDARFAPPAYATDGAVGPAVLAALQSGALLPEQPGTGTAL